MSDLNKLACEISREAIAILERTKTPPFPTYYAKAFLDVAARHGDDVLREIEQKNIRYHNAILDKNLEESLDFARGALQDYNETTERLREITYEQDRVILDLKKIEASDTVPASIIDEFRAHYASLTDEVHKAEETIKTLEVNLQRLETDSFIDPLTHLRTLALYRRQLDQILQVGRNRNLDLWVALVTIDDYDALKDRYGYTVMEKVLLFVAKSLQGTIRSDNAIYRYKESPRDEGVFCVVFNRNDKTGVYNAVSRARARVEASKLIYADNVILITISAVIVPHRAEDNVDTISARAEDALAKYVNNTRNSVHIADF
ncbi:MAG: GGDEF domain-containing protein [Helicobacteraceae bacterium]|jgi:diguanylate cyclase (GGDEF)-like protein|nr:GGDEF domain-containing protein [Helicobacteraceae bacterium]